MTEYYKGLQVVTEDRLLSPGFREALRTASFRTYVVDGHIVIGPNDMATNLAVRDMTQPRRQPTPPPASPPDQSQEQPGKPRTFMPSMHTRLLREQLADMAAAASSPAPPAPPASPLNELTLVSDDGQVYGRGVDGVWRPRTTLAGTPQRDTNAAGMTVVGGGPGGTVVPASLFPGGPPALDPLRRPLFHRGPRTPGVPG